MVAIRAKVARLLARQSGARRLPPVLILGETGTGKGLLARSIHQAGARREGPFVDLNCAAIPETLLEAELFGYERGAFTDARQAKPGLFQAAHRGTLFLDEIGLLPAAVQGKLLTAIEDRVVRRLGATRTEAVDVAILAATSVDLTRALDEGRFREDLYHRLAVITLELPPLRARGTDIIALAQHFLARACADYGLLPRALTREARQRLADYRWPGNVRELANAMERVALFSDSDEIPAAMLDFLMSDTAGAVARDDDTGSTTSLEAALRTRIEEALRETDGNIRRTAAALGISRNTLRARMDRYGLRERHATHPRPGSAPVPLASAARSVALRWERRHVAFLQVTLLPTSTVEAARALDLIGEKVRYFGGRIEEFAPKRLIAVFGMEPVDNAPTHAAMAALAIQNAASRAKTTGSGEADIVIGLHGGDHLVGYQGSRSQLGVDGKGVAWSALEHLVADAAPGTIAVTAAVAPFLRRRFTLHQLDQTERNAWLLVRREDTPGPVTRFVARASEIETLQLARARAEQGQGQIVGVVGEAGVGKSRLFQEIAATLHGWRVLSSAGLVYGKSTSYLPMVEILKAYCHVEGTDTPTDMRTKVAATLPPGVGDAGDVTSPLLDVLGILAAEDPFHRLEPKQRRQRTIETITQLLVTANATEPLCVILEDLHWIDSETQAVLDRLVNALTTSRLLLLVNYRPEYRHGWASRSHYTHLRLDPLPSDAVEQLLLDLLGPDPSLQDLKRTLMIRTEGNPFFLEECVRSLVETGALIGESGAYRDVGTRAAVDVPATVQAVLAARIDRLPPGEKDLLQAAAVIGKDIPLTLLEAMAALPASTLRDRLAILEDCEFVYEARRVPQVEYTFTHALVHDVVYGGLLEERRQTLHARAAEAIERVYAGRLEEHVERLAHHTFEGHQWPQAFTHARAAGARALARFANREAVGFFDQALVALGHLEPTRERLEQGIDVRFAQRSAFVPLGDIKRILERFQEARDLAWELGDARRLGLALAGESNGLTLVGDFQAAVDAGRRAEEAVAGLRDTALQAAVGVYRGRALVSLGSYAEASALLAPITATLSSDQAREFRLPGVPVLSAVFARHWLATALTEQGRFDEAEGHATNALAIAQVVGDPRSPSPSDADTLVWAWLAIGNTALTRGLFRSAVGPFEGMLDLCRAHDFRVYTLIAASGLANAHAGVGSAENAVSTLSPLVQETRKRRQVNALALSLIRLGEASLMAGAEFDARDAAEEAFELAKRYGMRGMQAYALRLQAEALQRGGPSNRGAADMTYAEALTIAEALGMRPLAARCRVGLGTLAGERGDATHARKELRRAIDAMREMGMGHWLTRAEATLDALR